MYRNIPNSSMLRSKPQVSLYIVHPHVALYVTLVTLGRSSCAGLEFGVGQVAETDLHMFATPGDLDKVANLDGQMSLFLHSHVYQTPNPKPKTPNAKASIPNLTPHPLLSSRISHLSYSLNSFKGVI